MHRKQEMRPWFYRDGRTNWGWKDEKDGNKKRRKSQSDEKKMKKEDIYDKIDKLGNNGVYDVISDNVWKEKEEVNEKTNMTMMIMLMENKGKLGYWGNLK